MIEGKDLVDKWLSFKIITYCTNEYKYVNAKESLKKANGKFIALNLHLNHGQDTREASRTVPK